MQEKIENILKNIPQQGFIKLTSDKPAGISGADKAALIRKGNVFFNDGEYEKAKRIFLTTGYTDGLIRIGDWYLSQNNPVEAIRMYWIAPAPDRVEEWITKASGAVGKWLKED
ncbi:MAG: hypothetical protein JEZ04_16265 [Spirochaetales bacterium]|nr:hypothetical protein [Spirochaetales bacterium]